MEIGSFDVSYVAKEAILGAIEISVLKLAADLDLVGAGVEVGVEDAWRRRPPRFEDALLGGLAGTSPSV